MTSETQEKSPLVAHAEAELRAAGLFDSDSDYGGDLGKAALELIEVFAGQGHSGFSAGMTVALFTELAAFKPITPLTDNPEEWMRVNPDDEEVGIWQNRRQGSAFSNDGGKTYYVLDEPMTPEGEQPLHNSKEHKRA